MIHARSLFFFFNDTATTEIYTLSLHDALPISSPGRPDELNRVTDQPDARLALTTGRRVARGLRLPIRDPEEPARSEEHTSELQSRQYLVCRLLLEKKKNEHTLEPGQQTVAYRR